MMDVKAETIEQERGTTGCKTKTETLTFSRNNLKESLYTFNGFVPSPLYRREIAWKERELPIRAMNNKSVWMNILVSMCRTLLSFQGYLLLGLGIQWGPKKQIKT
jgi:hypothetical protein